MALLMYSFIASPSGSLLTVRWMRRPPPRPSTNGRSTHSTGSTSPTILLCQGTNLMDQVVVPPL